jgi:NTP pyrophosphatase (non-canonical NTP hydrolase)
MTGQTMFNDAQTTVGLLRARVRQFVEDRDWRQFHSPKNLSMALAIEAAELMEHFQWISTDASRDLSADERRRAAVAEELSDVICYALALANEMEIDVSSALSDKLAKNAAKYPAEAFRGRYGIDDPNRPKPSSG